jgi:hypothetical protein
MQDPEGRGTTIFLKVESYTLFNPHARFSIRMGRCQPSIRGRFTPCTKWVASEPTSPHWYSAAIAESGRGLHRGGAPGRGCPDRPRVHFRVSRSFGYRDRVAPRSHRSMDCLRNESIGRRSAARTRRHRARHPPEAIPTACEDETARRLPDETPASHRERPPRRNDAPRRQTVPPSHSLQR